jgi:hypothetical protein
MSIYGILLFIHVVSAVCGLGATFALPTLMKLPKTVTQAKFAFHVNKKIEKIAKIGSIMLLATGLLMGWVNPELFKEIWFDASIVIYVLVQPIVAGVLPKKMKRQMDILENTSTEQLPEEYLKISKALKPYDIIMNTAAILLLFLMTIKPF